MIVIKITDKRLRTFLDERVAKLRNTLGLMREIAGIMLDEVEENFAQQGRPGWKDLKPSTKKKRGKTGHWPGPILQVSGVLASSISPRITETSAAVGTNLSYAAAQQFGATIIQYPRSSLFRQNRHEKGPKAGRFRPGHDNTVVGGKGKSTFGQRVIKIPARPFLKVTQEGLKKIKDAVKRFLARP